MTEMVSRVELSEHIAAEFSDQSNRYYGDFHRVLINVSVRIDLAVIADRPDILALLPTGQDSLRFTTTLEQMAVPTAQLDSVRKSLVGAFLENTGRYLLKTAFIENLIHKQK